MTAKECVDFCLGGRALPPSIERADLEQEAELAALQGLSEMAIRKAVWRRIKRAQRTTNREIPLPPHREPYRNPRHIEEDIDFNRAVYALPWELRQIVLAVLQGHSPAEFTYGEALFVRAIRRLKKNLWKTVENAPAVSYIYEDANATHRQHIAG